MATSSGAGGSNAGPEALDVIIAVAVILLMAWLVFSKGVSGGILTYAEWSARLRGMIPIGDAAWWTHLSVHLQTLNPKTLKFHDDVTLLDVAGKAWLWPFLATAGGLSAWIYSGSVSQKYRRRMNMDRLLMEQSKFFSAILPAVISNLPYHRRETGPWRRAMLPYEWALSRKLIYADSHDPDMDLRSMLNFLKTGEAQPSIPEHLPHLRVQAAQSAFRMDVACDPLLLKYYPRMKKTRLALAAAICLWCAGDYEDEAYATKGGNRLFAHYNETFKPWSIYYPTGKVWHPIIKNICEAWINWSTPGIERYRSKKSRAIVRVFSVFGVRVDERITVDLDVGVDFLKYGHALTQARAKGTLKGPVSIEEKAFGIFLEQAGKHAFQIPFLLSLLERARKYNVLPPANFMWLKPLDRPAFYAMNNLGRPGSWTECAGNVAHYRAEVFAGGPIKEPRVQPAVEALIRELADHRWISENPIS